MELHWDILVAPHTTGPLRQLGCTVNSYPSACVPSREAVCTIFMMVFGMTRPGCKPTTAAREADTLWGMHFKDLLASIARVGYLIPVLVFSLGLHGLRCRKTL